jgi:hypothetical protein
VNCLGVDFPDDLPEINFLGEPTEVCVRSEMQGEPSADEVAHIADEPLNLHTEDFPVGEVQTNLDILNSESQEPTEFAISDPHEAGVEKEESQAYFSEDSASTQAAATIDTPSEQHVEQGSKSGMLKRKLEEVSAEPTLENLLRRTEEAEREVAEQQRQIEEIQARQASAQLRYESAHIEIEELEKWIQDSPVVRTLVGPAPVINFDTIEQRRQFDRLQHSVDVLTVVNVWYQVGYLAKL